MAPRGCLGRSSVFGRRCPATPCVWLASPHWFPSAVYIWWFSCPCTWLPPPGLGQEGGFTALVMTVPSPTPTPSGLGAALLASIAAPAPRPRVPSLPSSRAPWTPLLFVSSCSLAEALQCWSHKVVGWAAASGSPGSVGRYSTVMSLHPPPGPGAAYLPCPPPAGGSRLARDLVCPSCTEYQMADESWGLPGSAPGSPRRGEAGLPMVKGTKQMLASDCGL